VLNNLLDVPYHHIVMSIPWQLRIVIAMNRKKGLNLLVRAAIESIAQWARDVKKMRMPQSPTHSGWGDGELGRWGAGQIAPSMIVVHDYV
jgi:hypothetical protein